MENLKEKIQTVVNIYKSGNIVKAEEMGKNLIISNPKIPFLYNFVGIVLAAQNKIDEAIKFYKKGIEVDPKFGLFYNNLGLIFFNRKSIHNEGNNIKKAEALYKKSIELDKKNPEPFTNLGNLYNFINNTEESIKHHKIAIEVNPNFYVAYSNLANVYLAIGNFAEAKKCLNEAIKINVNFTLAHRSLSRITKYKKSDSHFKQLKTVYINTNENKIDDKMNLAYALGKANEDIQNFDESFTFYEKANSLYRKKIQFSIESEKEKFNDIKSTFTKKIFNKFSSLGSKNPNSIFIVGMPRSGTTLIEQMLSTHKKVYGADEVEFIPDLIIKYFNNNSKMNLFFKEIYDFEPKELKNMGSEYIMKMKNISKNSIKTTDKLPANFLFIGLIKLILPNSKIIHCYRNPLDNVFSIFKNHFPGGKINFAYNLSEIVEYYKLYHDLMKHWNLILPNFILNIKYEDLILNTKKEIKNMLNFCDLEWEKECLKFYNNKRPIRTASDTQARNKIYNTSINSWRNYEKYLKKYYDALDV